MIPVWRARFPVFREHPELVYLDSASTAQRLDRTLAAMQDYFLHFNANVHRGVYPLAEEATERYEAARVSIQKFLNAKESCEIIFTRGTTEGVNLLAHTWGDAMLNEGDEIVLSVLEHHANLVPWQELAKRKNLTLKFIPLLASGDLDLAYFEQILSSKTKLVAITGLSNVLGSLTPLKSILQAAHRSGAKILVDAAQLVAHMPIDVQALDVDFLVFSGHKLYGPTGIGVLYAKRAILEAMPVWMTGGDMIRSVDFLTSTWNDLPWKFEAGTPPIAEAIGLASAVDFLQSCSWEDIHLHEKELHDFLIARFSQIPFVRLLGSKDFHTHRSVYSFTVDHVHPHDVAAILGEDGVCIRAGHHCAMPLMKTLGVSATNRISFGLYTSTEDIEKAATALEKVVHKFQ